YVPGGYHPVHLGDVFRDRYVIEHKLGHGGISTVWLARDLQQGRVVAMKILMAATSCSPDSPFLRHLNSQDKSTGKCMEMNGASAHHPPFFPTLLDEFTIHGPNGEHLCLVTEVLGPSLDVVQDCCEQEMLPVEVAKKVVVQLIQAIIELHNCGIVHGGISTFPLLSRFHTHLGKPVRRYLNETHYNAPRGRKLLKGSPQLPQYIVEAARFDELVELCFESPAIRVIDFGESFFWHSQAVNKLVGIPLLYAAPEVLFEENLTPACDIWALGCLIFMLFGCTNLWRGFDYKDSLLVCWTLNFGQLPECWWGKWEDRLTFFEEDGTFRSGLDVAADMHPGMDMFTWVIKRLHEGMEPIIPRLGHEEVVTLARLIMAMVKLDPGKRIKAKDVLE
ncbi:kinase-like domain-containing protein, partial [Kalaharituber pfeilii]